MRKRIKNRSHKRKKVSLTRKRRKTHNSKRVHKRTMKGGVQRGDSGVQRGDTGEPLTHTTNTHHSVTIPSEAEKKQAAQRLLIELKTKIQGYQSIVNPMFGVLFRGPSTIEEYEELFVRVWDHHYTHRKVEAILADISQQALIPM